MKTGEPLFKVVAAAAWTVIVVVLEWYLPQQAAGVNIDSRQFSRSLNKKADRSSEAPVSPFA